MIFPRRGSNREFTGVQILTGKVAEKMKTDIKKRASGEVKPLKALVYWGFPCIKDSVYIDKGYSGGNTNRPEFLELLKDVKNGNISKVIVYKVDRISRSLKDFVDIYSDFEKYNVEFESCSEQFDTSSAMGKATLQIIMVFAELERNMIKKRVTDNFYERGKKGLFLAGVEPFGYKKIPCVIDGINTHMLEADVYQSEIVQFIYNKYIEEKSIGSVVNELNSKGYKTNRDKGFTNVAVRRILRNPVYVRSNADVYMYLESRGAVINQPIDDFIGVYGCTVYSKRDNKSRAKFSDYSGENVQMNLHQGIIDADLWLAVQHELDKNKPISNSGKGTHTWLTGLTKCGYCGLGISVVNGQRDGKRYINCGGRKNKNCYGRKRHITFDEIEKVVENESIAYIKAFQFTKIEKNNNRSKEENDLKIKIKKIQDEIDNLIDKVSMANEDVMKLINKRVKSLTVQRQELLMRIAAFSSDDLQLLSDEVLKKALTDWGKLSFGEKKLIANTFISNIIITDEEVRINYK